MVPDGRERPEVGRLGVRNLGRVHGGDGQVVGADDPEPPLVGHVADDALHSVGVDVAIESGQAELERELWLIFPLQNHKSATFPFLILMSMIMPQPAP